MGIQYFVKHIFHFCEVTDARKGSLQKRLKVPEIDTFYLNFIVHLNDNFLCFLLTAKVWPSNFVHLTGLGATG